MVKRKSLPLRAEKAGYAARTAQRVSERSGSSSDPSQETESSTEEEETKGESEQQTVSRSKISRIDSTTNNTKLTKSNITKKRKKTSALRDIKLLQKTTNLLIPRAPFLRLIKELMQQRSGGGPNALRITEMAVEALREASENVLVSVFEDSYLLALHAKRVTLFPRDMALLLRIRNDFNLISSI